MLPSPQPTAAGSSPRPARRPRAIQACNLCRSKKYKCDGVCPCSHCRRRGLHCVYRVAPVVERDAATRSLVQDLERRLELAQAENARLRAPYGALASHHPSPEDPHTAPVTAFSISPPSEHPMGPGRPDEDEVSPEEGPEIVEVNPLTRDIEFHGHTSSVAFLGRVRQEYGCAEGDMQEEQQATVPQRHLLVGALHNNHPAMSSPQRSDVPRWNNGPPDDRFFFPQSYVFLESFFKTIHYIHPILDKEAFYSRCNDLWQGRYENQPRSFIALYFSLVSLGAIVRTWTEEKINGMGRFEWSRMIFEKAQLALGFPGSAHDLEAGQALIFMAKVCQNELNPNLAYTYLGLASRTLLAIGANRNASIDRLRPGTPPEASEAAKAWWGLYALEIEMSFALGRPDCLGADDYHNRPLPPLDGSVVDIIPGMIALSRIMRSISIKVYLNRLSLAQKLQSAITIEMEMDAWVARLPEAIMPQFTRDVDQHCRLGDPPWAFVQRLVLQIRYYNVKMLLLRPFLLHAARYNEREPSLDDAVHKCTEAAAKTIELIHETYRVHIFFRNWMYNITYLTFAASIILFRAGQTLHIESQQRDYIRLIEQTLSMIDIMHESPVACKTARVIRQMLAILRQRAAAGRFLTAKSDDASAAAERPADPRNSSWSTPRTKAGAAAAAAAGGVEGAAVGAVPEDGSSSSIFGGGEFEVADLGLDSLDACFWDWRTFDFRDIWGENNNINTGGPGFQSLS